MNDGLSDETRQRIFAVLASFPDVAKATLYGSRARGDYRRASDIDLAVETADGSPLGWNRVLDIHGAIDDLDLILKTDVVDRNAIKSASLAEAIARDGVVFWERNSVAAGKGMA